MIASSDAVVDSLKRKHRKPDDALRSEEFLLDPYPVYDWLRAESPVYWSEGWSCWVVTRYDDVTSAAREDGRLYSSVGRTASPIDRFPPPVREELHLLRDHYKGALIHSDPPDHTRHRTLVSKILTPRVFREMRPQIQRYVDELLDAVHGDTMDAVRDLAFPLPVRVIADVLGLPVEDREQFKTWCDELTGFANSNQPSTEDAIRAQHGLTQLRESIARTVSLRRRDPTADFLSALAAMPSDVLSEAELLTICVTLFLGGHETTTALIGSGLLSLLREPGQLQRLREDPDLIDTALEEFLRFETPTPRLMRVVKEDVELRGQRLAKGQLCMLNLGAANRDPEQFDDPDRLDIGRQPNRHLAFGSGIHFCIGAPLARVEGAVAIETILRRFPSLRLRDDSPPIWLRRHGLRKLETLPLWLH